MKPARRVLLQATAASFACPGALWAQVKKTFRVGFLVTSNAPTAQPVMEVFIAGLREKGYHVGGNLSLDVRYAEGDVARLPALADELLALKPDLLLGVEAAAIVLRSKTTTIPIVLLASNDPVAAGLAKSLARPGTNVTGLANRFDQVLEKQIELLLEVAPGISLLGLLNYGPSSAETAARFRRAAEAAARRKNLAVVSAVARDAETLRQAFAEFETAKVSALIIVPTSTALQEREAIAGHAMRLRLPSIGAFPPAWTDAGALLNYGANSLEDFRYVTSIVDRVLKGANPAEMPIEQPGRFFLAVNLKTARQLGLKIPQSVLARADRVIADH